MTLKILEQLRLIRRSEGWIPTRRALLLLLLTTGAVVVAAARWVHPFLAVTAPVDAEVLVAEGWLPDFALEVSLRELSRGHYRELIVTGGPIEKGEPLSEYRTLAEMSAATLVRLGGPTNRIRAVPAPKVRHDRTYTSAFALREALRREDSLPRRINVVTADAHARRTRLLFQKAFGDDTEIGIIAVPDTRFIPARWWRSSMGFRTVTGEAIAYLYARFLFSPPEDLLNPQSEPR